MLPMGMMSPFPQKPPVSGVFSGGVAVYGYRHYTPKTGQFLGRDPIEERGGMNLYGFVGNDGVGKFDILGFEIAREVQLSDINLRYEVITNEGGPIEFFIGGIGGWGQPWWRASGGYQNYEKGVDSWVKVSSGCSGSPQCNTVNNDKSSDAGALFIGARHLNDDGCIYSYDILLQ